MCAAAAATSAATATVTSATIRRALFFSFSIPSEHSAELFLDSFQCFLLSPFILIVVFHVRSNSTFNNNLMSTFILRMHRILLLALAKKKNCKQQRSTHEPTQNAFVLRQNGCVVVVIVIIVNHERVWHSISNARVHGQRRTNDGVNSTCTMIQSHRVIVMV